MRMQTMICLRTRMQMYAKWNGCKCNEMQEMAAKRLMVAAVGKIPNDTRGHLLNMPNVLESNAQWN